MILFKKNKYTILLSLTFLILVVFSIIIWMTSNRHYDQQGTNLINFRLISKFNTLETSTSLFEQTFISQNENLSYVNFYVSNKSGQTVITVSLAKDDNNNILLTKKIIIPSANYPQYINWEFESIKNSLNKKYSLLIEVPSVADLDFITVSPNLYKEGILLTNGLPTDNILAFSYGYSTNNLLPIIKNRITTYKPFIFKYYISFIVLIVLILSLTIYIIYLLAKLLDYN